MASKKQQQEKQARLRSAHFLYGNMSYMQRLLHAQALKERLDLLNEYIDHLEDVMTEIELGEDINADA